MRPARAAARAPIEEYVEARLQLVPDPHQDVGEVLERVQLTGPRLWRRAPQSGHSNDALEIPELLRPILLRWWTLAGRPREGVVFPVRRENCSNNRAGLERQNVSHAEAFRRDLQRAFEFAIGRGIAAPRRGSQRWKQLFVETEQTRPVDFHSWRRAYCQALDDAGVTLQQAAALAGHENFATHGGYLRNASKMRRLPPDAVPRLRPREKALQKAGRRMIPMNLTQNQPPHRGLSRN